MYLLSAAGPSTVIFQPPIELCSLHVSPSVLLQPWYKVDLLGRSSGQDDRNRTVLSQDLE